MKTTVVGRGKTYDVYIGRKRGTIQHFGNPFTTMRRSLGSVLVPTRRDAIDAFRRWLKGEDYLNVEPERRAWILDNLDVLRGNRLGCFCKPLSCHGDVYVEMLEEEQTNERNDYQARSVSPPQDECA